MISLQSFMSLARYDKVAMVDESIIKCALSAINKNTKWDYQEEAAESPLKAIPDK